MKQLGRMILPALALLILLLVRAMAYDAVEVEIPVKTNESCVIELAGDFTDQKTIDGSGAFTVSVSHPGTYNCQVRQIPGTEENKIYDQRVYNVLLFVETDGDALRSAIVLSLDGEAEKPAELIFENETAEPPIPEEPDRPEPPSEPDQPEIPGEPDMPDIPGEPDMPDMPDTPSDPAKPQYHRASHDSSTPATGDGSRLAFWGVTFALGAGLLTGGVTVWRRRNNHGGSEQ